MSRTRHHSLKWGSRRSSHDPRTLWVGLYRLGHPPGWYRRLMLTRRIRAQQREALGISLRLDRSVLDDWDSPVDPEWEDDDPWYPTKKGPRYWDLW